MPFADAFLSQAPCSKLSPPNIARWYSAERKARGPLPLDGLVQHIISLKIGAPETHIHFWTQAFFT